MGQPVGPCCSIAGMAFKTVRTGYERSGGDSSFLDYFWSWRSLASAVLAVLLPTLPPARCYHAVSTGFAGLLGARLAASTGRPLILTEHGIYTNERRIEIAMADWLYRGPEASFAPRKTVRDLRDLWMEAFEGFARLTYAAAGPIVTLYRGNQGLQLRDGALAARCTIIPNGVDADRYAAIPRSPEPRPPTVALIGRVVPIKDVKTFIRAVGLLRRKVPDARGEILGPLEEDPIYARECAALIRQLGLEDAVTLHGSIAVPEWLGRIDVNVLTSISEAQPLTILEAGAAGVPCIATNVGACREMIEGDPPGETKLRPGGIITPVANPAATAEAMARLLTDPAAWSDGERRHPRSCPHPLPQIRLRPRLPRALPARRRYETRGVGDRHGRHRLRPPPAHPARRPLGRAASLHRRRRHHVRTVAADGAGHRRLRPGERLVGRIAGLPIVPDHALV